MTCHINQRIKKSDTGYGYPEQVFAISPDNGFFGSELFPGKWRNQYCCKAPAVKCEGNRVNLFNNSSCNNKITRPDDNSE
jgi:hypothetical protein